MLWAILAVLILLLHLCFVVFVVLGEILILVGAALSWGWIRNLWFRLTHLGCILFVALEALIGVLCPLTEWEYALRLRAGQDPTEGDLITRIVHAVIFQDWPPWVFTSIHLGFAALVIATLLLFPPRWSDLRGAHGRRAT
jgi:Protein of Unknown function (DUF2784)